VPSIWHRTETCQSSLPFPGPAEGGTKLSSTSNPREGIKTGGWLDPRGPGAPEATLLMTGDTTQHIRADFLI
jgi:hypothetical protein